MCPEDEACPGGFTEPGANQCARGYTGILCAICDKGYYQGSLGTCVKCEATDKVTGADAGLMATIYYSCAVAIPFFGSFIGLYLYMRDRRHVKKLDAHGNIIYTGINKISFLRHLKVANVYFVLHPRTLF